MQFKEDARVYDLAGENVGHVDRVVLDPETKEVTHIVIRQGFLFTEDKVLPIKLIATATEDRIDLNLKGEALEHLPAFEETHYVPLSDEELHTVAYPPDMAYPLYWYLPVGNWTEYTPTGTPGRAETQQNIPENTVALKEGAKVFSLEGKHIGQVETIFTDSAKNRATYFLISQGLLLKERKAIPTSWIRRFEQDEVHLNVSAATLNNLHEYEQA